MKQIKKIDFSASFLLIIIFIFSSEIFSQTINRLNKHGERTGKWITFIDDAKKLKSFEGKFRNGNSYGKGYFYNNDGVLDRREINRFKKMKTTFYYTNGRVKLKGNARLENLPDKIHYYFYGRWKAFNDSGQLIKYCYYKKGSLVKTIYLDGNNKTNDSLIEALNVIDKEFALHNNTLVDSINVNFKNILKSKEFECQLKEKDSLSFLKITQILNIYGYPSKQIAGESSVIPFYILGFAPLQIKIKYLELLKLAANNGDISWKSLAFFIDKIKVAKNEKQIYGTQSYYDKHYKEFLYPIDDEAGVNQRRLDVGLEKLEP